jgi:hypothetical protein
MPRLFEQGADVDPILTHRVGQGLAGNTTKNSTWATILAWLQANLVFASGDIITEEVAFSAWDMDANSGFAVAWALPAGHKIVGMKAVIHAGGTQTWDLSSLNVATGNINGAIFDYSGGNFNMTRLTGGDFDQAVPFNNASGYVLVQHKDFS